MKKLLSLAAILVAGALFLTACGGSGEKLECTGVESMEGITVNTKIIVKFNNDKVSKVSSAMTFDDSEIAQAVGGILQQLESQSGEKIGISVSGKTINIDDMLKFNKLNGADEEDKYTGISKADAKKEFEEAGYTCK